MKIDPKNKADLSAQIAKAIRDAIISGDMIVDERLPSEAELADQFDVSRPTVREALKRLAAQNLIRTQRGATGGAGSASAAAHDGAEFDLVGRRQRCVLSEELFAADHQHRARKDLEARQQGRHAFHALDLELLALRLQEDLHRSRATRRVGGGPALP